MEGFEAKILMLLVEGLVQLGLTVTLLLCAYKLKKLSIPEFSPACRTLSLGMFWLAVSIIVPFILGLIAPLVLEDSINEYYYVLFELPYSALTIVSMFIFMSAYRKFKIIANAT
ncbi:hypothetical protein AN214_04387 [Pseudoalteromonas sp. P1-9]|uniref:hypothetical protein n=1 Tax=Pseudoalteromonas sp. P1-9 TaxID=1710354 RepID=UPI0006D5FFB1|nr:hypothetical protein [Pseudoalteromonas sp. P1-9]KPV93584.1 hypothetical protein AN214_04387 [Pseudoalteromonas sp. P1-9]